MIFAVIDEHLAARYPVDVACDVLEVSRSGHYAWRGRPASARSARRDERSAAIARVHGENRGAYGSPRSARGEWAVDITCVATGEGWPHTAA